MQHVDCTIILAFILQWMASQKIEVRLNWGSICQTSLSAIARCQQNNISRWNQTRDEDGLSSHAVGRPIIMGEICVNRKLSDDGPTQAGRVSPKAKHDSRTSRRGSIIWSTPYKRPWGPAWRMGAVMDRGGGGGVSIGGMLVDRLGGYNSQGGSVQVTRVVLSSTGSSCLPLPPPPIHHHQGPATQMTKPFWWVPLMSVQHSGHRTIQGNLSLWTQDLLVSPSVTVSPFVYCSETPSSTRLNLYHSFKSTHLSILWPPSLPKNLQIIILPKTTIHHLSSGGQFTPTFKRGPVVIGWTEFRMIIISAPVIVWLSLH